MLCRRRVTGTDCFLCNAANHEYCVTHNYCSAADCTLVLWTNQSVWPQVSGVDTSSFLPRYCYYT